MFATTKVEKFSEIAKNDLNDFKVIKDFNDISDIRVLKDFKDFKDIKDIREFKVAPHAALTQKTLRSIIQSTVGFIEVIP